MTCESSSVASASGDDDGDAPDHGDDVPGKRAVFHLRDGGTKLGNALDELPSAEKRLYMQEAGRKIYSSLARYAVMFCVRQLAERLSAPRVIDMLRIKHLVKYLLGTKGWGWAFWLQEVPKIGQK